MTEEKRSYRKCLSSHGFIYLANKELEISVRNLSITGLLAELDTNKFISEIEEVFCVLNSSAMIDLYLPEMRLAGEADVVRAEKIDGRIYLALEFRNLSYDIDNLLYKRKAYRKALSASGEIDFNGEKHVFLTKNVSIDGLMVSLKHNVNIDVGTVATFDFPELALDGKIKVIWIEKMGDGSTLMGLQYIQMIREGIDGVPSFLSGR